MKRPSFSPTLINGLLRRQLMVLNGTQWDAMTPPPADYGPLEGTGCHPPAALKTPVKCSAQMPSVVKSNKSPQGDIMG